MRNTPKIASLCLACIASLISVFTMNAAPGDLDLTFSQDGKLFDFFRLGGEDRINGTAIQADGKIVAAGSFFFGGTRSCAVSRYNTDGSLDPTFDGDGIAIFTSGRECVFTSVAIQADGKIVAAGRIGTFAVDDFVVFRYNTDGSLDSSFSADGIAIFSQPGDDDANGLVIQPDGKIIVAGKSGGSGTDFMLVRYNPDGSLDTSFGTNGRVLNGIGTLWAVGLQTDGKIVAVGHINFSAVAARYNTNGTLDTTFDSDGIVTFDLYSGSARAVAIQADGKIVVAGYGTIFTGPGFPPPQNVEMAIARLNADGSLDSSFDLDGKTTTTLPTSNDRAWDIAIQADGKIVIAGDTEPQSSPYVQQFVLARYNTDGSLDGSFNGTGIFIWTQSKIDSVAHAVSIQSDGKIVAAGFQYFCCGSWDDFAVLRLNTNGSLDNSFSSDGSTHHDVGFRQSSARAVAMQPNGKFVVVGTTLNDDFEWGVVRYNADGTPDTSFDTDGKTTIDLLSGADEARAVAIQPDGKVLVAGYAGFTSPQSGPMDAVVLRYNTNGSLDPTFDSDGKVLVDLGVWDFANAIAVQPDGKIVIAGSFVDTDYTMMLFRLNPDGSLDSSFDMDGKVLVPGLVSDQAFAVAIQTDGKILAAGRAFNVSSEDFVVVRLNTDGSLDTSFDFDGTATTPVGSGNDSANAIAIQGDGRIVVAGRSSSGGSDDYALVRYNPSGSLDTSFDFDGKVTTWIGGLADEAKAVSIQANGKIIAAGTSNMTGFNGEDFSMVRYNTDGSLDSTFGEEGRRNFDFWGTSKDQLFGMALDSAGRAVVVGETSSNFAVARVLLDFVPSGGTPFDFDGDGKAEVAVYRPSTNIWYQLFSSGIPYGSPTFGVAGDVPVPADYDGDGKTDLAIFRPSTGDWWYRASSDASLRTGHWGADGDIPLPADINNDGKDDFVVFRPSTNFWYRITTAGVQEEFAFGLAGDKPVIGDFDGDGRADHAVFRPSTGDWWYAASSAGRAFRTTHWGQNGDIPAPADFDGDGKTDMAVFRPSNGGWYVLKSGDQSYITTAFGLNGDRPIPADYDGDGRADIAVFRPSTGIWYLLQSTAGIGGVQWGLASDIAVPNAFIQP